MRAISASLVLALAAPAAAQTRLTGDWGGARTTVEERGFTIIGAYTGEVMANLTGPVERRLVYAGLAEAGIDIDLKVVEPKLGLFHIYGYAVHGEGLTETLGDLHGVSNIVAEPEVRLFELWYDQLLFGGAFGLRLGLQSADQEFVVAPHAIPLLNATFGIPSQASTNLGGPVYPVATLAVRARARVGDWSLAAALFDGEQENRHGIPSAVGESALGFVELAWQDAIKLGAWIHSDREDAIYAIYDHELGGGWASWCRLGVSPGAPVELYADAGLSVTGVIPGRPRDGVVLGVAHAEGERRETVVELTYVLAFAGWGILQPDLQWHKNERNHVVLGMRLVVDL